MKSNMIINVKFLAGTTIEQASAGMLIFAKFLKGGVGMTISTEFVPHNTEIKRRRIILAKKWRYL